jgi:hypothetical protein
MELKDATEYHPYAACLMFKACHDGETVRANLDGVRANGAQWEYEALMPKHDALAARLAEAERDAARYRTRRAEFSQTLNERPDLYDMETDALMRLRNTVSAPAAPECQHDVNKPNCSWTAGPPWRCIRCGEMWERADLTVGASSAGAAPND